MTQAASCIFHFIFISIFVVRVTVSIVFIGRAGASQSRGWSVCSIALVSARTHSPGCALKVLFFFTLPLSSWCESPFCLRLPCSASCARTLACHLKHPFQTLRFLRLLKLYRRELDQLIGPLSMLEALVGGRDRQ